MDSTTRAALFAGITTAVLAYLFAFIDTSIFEKPEYITHKDYLMLSAIMEAIGAGLAILLLVVLYPIYKRAPNNLSITVFSLIGTVIPFFVIYTASTIGAHGETAAFYGPTRQHAIFQIASFSFIGFMASLTAWLTLKFTEDENT